MTELRSSLVVNVDMTNPGQFFACCGLMELAHRLWPEGAEGWFELQSGKGRFFIRSITHIDHDSSELLSALAYCPIQSLSDEEKQERDRLEKSKKTLSKQDEDRRKALGKSARAGALNIGAPFLLRLDWWQTNNDEVVKTWAGVQEIHKIARAAQDALRKVKDFESLFDYSCVLYTPAEYLKKKAGKKKSVAPFYFDAHQSAHRLDVGYSLDALDTVEVLAHPAVELLALIGLQRFRPAPSQQKWHFEYWAWSYPIPAPVAAAVVCGRASIEAKYHYRFRLLFRDDQRRYKAFSFATLTPTGE